MTVLPVVLLLAAAAGLGVYIGLLYLRGQRRAGLIGLHLLLGLGGLEGIVILLRGTPNGNAAAGGSLGNTAAAVLVIAAFAGFISPVIGRRSRKNGDVALVAHVGAGALGVLLFLVWVASM